MDYTFSVFGIFALSFLIINVHYAALIDHWAICFLIIQQQIEDKILKDTSEIGFTLLHVAATENKFDICKLFIRNTTKKNPKDNFGYAPIDVPDFFLGGV